MKTCRTRPRPPWERRPGESAQAFAAFTLYRAMGPSRSIDAVGARLKGVQKSSKRGATGRLFLWSADHDWTARAAAWDDHLAAQERKATERAARERGRRAVRLQDEILDDLVRVGKLIMSQSEVTLSFPAAEQEVRADGKVTIVRATDPLDKYRAARMAQAGIAIVQAAIDKMNELFKAGGAADLVVTDEVQEWAARKTIEWRQRLRDRLARLTPPALPEEPPRDEPGETGTARDGGRADRCAK